MITPSVTLVRRVCAYVDAHLDEPLGLATLARAVGASPFHVQRTFRRAMGISPRAFVRARRIERLKAKLRRGDDVTRAVYDTGFGSASRIYERSDVELGMTPATLRRGGRGMTIEYAVVDSPLGRLLVGATERGLCAVSLGENDARLVAALHDQYPAAEIVRSGDGLVREVAAVLDRLAGGSSDLPLDLAATSFQIRVWQALRAIPRGETRTYGEIARSIGRPKAARAVARACATNPVAIVVPCHRAVRADGDLGGYRWGVERKKRLLEEEDL